MRKIHATATTPENIRVASAHLALSLFWGSALVGALNQFVL